MLKRFNIFLSIPSRAIWNLIECELAPPGYVTAAPAPNGPESKGTNHKALSRVRRKEGRGKENRGRKALRETPEKLAEHNQSKEEAHEATEFLPAVQDQGARLVRCATPRTLVLRRRQGFSCFMRRFFRLAMFSHFSQGFTKSCSSTTLLLALLLPRNKRTAVRSAH